MKLRVTDFRLSFCRLAGLILLLAGVPDPLWAAMPRVSISAERVELPGAQLRSVTVELTPDSGLRIGAAGLSLDAWPEPLSNFELTCPESGIGQPDVCNGAEWRVGVAGLIDGQPPTRVTGRLAGIDLDQLSIASSVEANGFKLSVQALAEGEQSRLTVSWSGQPLLNLRDFKLAPPQIRWLTRGGTDGRLVLDGVESAAPVGELHYSLNDVAFDSPDGLYAAEALSIGGSARFELGDVLSGTVGSTISGGEVLIHDFYRNFDDQGMDFSADILVDGSQLRLEKARLTDGSAMMLSGAVRLDPADSSKPPEVVLHQLDLRFPQAYRRYFESVAAIYTLDGLEVTGNVQWRGRWVNGDFESGDLRIDDLSVVDIERQRFAVTGMDAHMQPGNYDFASTLSWRGLLLGPVNLGAAETGLESAPGRIALSRPLEMDVLGGQLVFEQFSIDLPGSILSLEHALDIRLRAEMRNMDMEQLTRAMGWPTFSGAVSGVIPGVSLEDGVLAVDGEVVFEVFDGRIALSDLSIERPFGVLPSLAADIDIYDLDLERVTQTFSFGQIGGRLDGYVHNLRMLDWEPVAFDAWLGTPERQDKATDISRQAVNRLTALGGGGATAALTGPIMKLFNNFSYRRLGLGCVLSNNVCEVRGLDDDDASVLIMEGAGIPKIMIRAFNRRLDFPQLVAGLTAVSGDESVRIGD